MTYKQWCMTDIFTGINIFIDWCEFHDFDYYDKEIFNLFVMCLKEGKIK
jgi:hypothetical protein